MEIKRKDLKEMTVAFVTLKSKVEDVHELISKVCREVTKDRFLTYAMDTANLKWFMESIARKEILKREKELRKKTF